MLSYYPKRYLLPSLCLIVTALLNLTVHGAQNLTLQWDPNVEPDVVTYRLYVGTFSQTYTQTIQVAAPVTSATVPGLATGQQYYFAVTAVNSAGMESGYSSEISYTVPGVGNVAPTLNPPNNIVLTQNAAMSTVSLTGISSGSPSESQLLTVIGLSSNPLLIPTPIVFYSSPAIGGVLTFKPLANTWGSATVTVLVNDGQLLNSSVSRSFSVTVNNPPTLDPIGNLSINQDASAQIVSLTGITSGALNESQSLQVTATSSNPALIPNPTLFYSSPNSSGILSYKSVAGASGSAVITVTVNDGQAGNNVTTRSFTVTVNPPLVIAVAPNVPPTLNPIGNILLAQNSGSTFLPVGGITSGSSSENQVLSVTAVSSNPSLIPAPIVSYSSPNSTGTVAISPVANSSGVATITVTVSDGQSANSTISRSFTVTINNPPTLNTFNDLSVAQDASAQTVNLSGISSGASGETQTLVLSASSSNPALIPAPTLFYASPSSLGTLSFKPVPGANGSAVLTVVVNDGQPGNNTVSRSFKVTVLPNLPPTLNPLGNLVVAQNAAAMNVALSGITSGSSAEVQPLTVTAISSNPALIPNPAVSYVSPNSTANLSVVPLSNMAGSATITITVSDGQTVNSTISRSFVVTVNNPPTLNPLGNLSLSQDAPTQTLGLSGITSGAANEAQILQVTATSSNPSLIPTPTIFYTSPNSGGSLVFKPASGATGSAVITLAVNDGQVGNSTITRSFTVTVNAVAPNIPPTLNPIANLVLAENAGIQSLGLTGVTSGSPAEFQPLIVSAVSSNPALIPNPAVTYSSPNTTGTLTFTPAANASGVATVVVTVSDGQSANSTISRSFSITVNNAPTLNLLNDLTLVQNSPSQTIALTGITSGAPSESQVLQVFAVSSNPGVIPNPSIFYASPNSTGLLTFTPVAGAVGSAVITVMVSDGQPGNSTVFRSFLVTLTSAPAAPNVPPTLDPISNVVVSQNSGPVPVLLSGLTAGGPTEVQTLTVTAVSSNPAFIPNPAVTYSSPNRTGTLSFTPVANTPGTAVITVTVSDGQSANSTITRSFSVTVNNSPTLNALGNVTVPVNSSSQTVSLSGISSGAPNEVQPLTVSAASSNTGLVPSPIVFYASPNSTGILFFTPVANVTGTATITVTVKDGQTGNGALSRSFVITVSPSVQTLSALSVEGEEITNDPSSVLPPDPDNLLPSSSPEPVPDTVTASAIPSGPVVSNLTVSSSDARKLLLTWQTDRPATCFLEYGTSGSLNWISDSTPLDTSHQVVLRDLQPATTYFVRVQSADDIGNFAVSDLSIVQSPPVNVLSWPAENGELSDTMVVGMDSDENGETYIAAADSEAATAIFSAEFPEGMAYRVWCRLKTVGTDGALAVSIDGNPESLASIPEDGSGEWRWVLLQSSGNLLTLEANGGFHQITVRPLAGGMRLDELCIANDAEWQPVSSLLTPALSASTRLDGSINLEWTAPWSNASGYIVESSADGVEFILMAEVNSTARDYQALGVEGSIYYRILAINSNDRSAFSPVVTTGLDAALVPASPVGLSIVVSEDGRAQLNWSDETLNSQGYILERSSDARNFLAVQSIDAGTTTASDLPPGPGHYFYRVRGLNNGTRSEPSEAVNVLF